MPPRRILIWSAALAAGRLFAFYIIDSRASHDALWQFSYAPLWVLDFPVSIAYFMCKLPIPLAEEVIGPIWWFFVPITFWRLFRKRKKD